MYHQDGMLKKVESEHLPVGTTFVRGAEGGSMASGRYPHPDSEVKRWCVWCQIMKSPINHKFHLWGICQRNVHFPHILVIKMGCELPKPVIHHPGVFHFQLGHPERKTFISHCYTSRGNSPIFTHSQKGEDVSDLQTPHSSKLKVTPNFAKCQTFESGFNKKNPIGKLPALRMISFKPIFSVNSWHLGIPVVVKALKTAG